MHCLKFILFLWTVVHVGVHCGAAEGEEDPAEAGEGGDGGETTGGDGGDGGETTGPDSGDGGDGGETTEPESECSWLDGGVYTCDQVVGSCIQDYCVGECTFNGIDCVIQSGDGGGDGGDVHACSSFDGQPNACSNEFVEGHCNKGVCELLCYYNSINGVCEPSHSGCFIFDNEPSLCEEDPYCENVDKGTTTWCVPSPPDTEPIPEVPGGGDDNGTGEGNGTGCNTITESNFMLCCYMTDSYYDKCWQFMCPSIDKDNFLYCCSGTDALSGGCPTFCSSITNDNKAACCEGSNPASGCFSYLCDSVTPSNYATCCAGAKTASGCTAACGGANPPSGCPTAACATISESNFGTCCATNPASGCTSYTCATASKINIGNYGTCCENIGKGAGCDEYCETSADTQCPADPCQTVRESNYGACCTESSTACTSFCTSHPSSTVCKSSGSSSVHVTRLLLLICFLLAAFQL